MKKKKFKKIDSVSKIKRRILKKWSLAIRKRSNFTCEYCGQSKGTINNKRIKCDAHHTLSKDIKNTPLKYDIRNGITLCSAHHKFSNESAHKAPIVFYEWYRLNYPDNYQFILENFQLRVDLENRKVLEEIENRLEKGLSLDLQRLQEIDKQYPRKNKKEITKGTLFDSDPKPSSSSSES